MDIEENEVVKYLLTCDIKPNLLGFTYLKDAIMIVNDHPDYLHKICKSLYPEIARLENTTASKVERAIRHALFTAEVKMTNSYFIALSLIKLSKII